MYAWVGDALRGYIAEHFDIKQTMIEDSVSTALAQALKDELFGEKHPTRIRRSPGPRDTTPGHSRFAARGRGEVGGAPGRERGWQDGWLPVVAGRVRTQDKDEYDRCKHNED